MTKDQTLTIGYTNYHGDYSVRRIIPLRVYFGSSEYHGPQWLLEAFDLDKQALRDFAMKDFSDVDPAIEGAYSEAQMVANENGFGPGTAADAIRYFASPTVRPSIEILAGPRTHICWTPDAVPLDMREEVVLVRRSDLEKVAELTAKKPAPDLEQGDFFTQLVPIPPGVYYGIDGQNFYDEETHKGMGTEFYATWRSRLMEFPKREGFHRHGEDGGTLTGRIYNPELAKTEAVPEWACWDKEVEDFVNKRTGNSAGVPFRLAWYERRDEFPDYLEYCQTAPVEAGPR